MTDHRGRALAAVESAARRQDYARDDLEVIVVTDGTTSRSGAADGCAHSGAPRFARRTDRLTARSARR